MSWVPARQHLAKVDSDRAWETSVHETPVLFSILERVVDQVGTDEEPKPSTASLAAGSAGHRTRSWWSTPADVRIPCLGRTPIQSVNSKPARIWQSARSVANGQVTDEGCRDGGSNADRALRCR